MVQDGGFIRSRVVFGKQPASYVVSGMGSRKPEWDVKRKGKTCVSFDYELSYFSLLGVLI